MLTNRIFWSDIYAQLSEFFKKPTEEFADDVASGRLTDYFNGVFTNLCLDVSLLEGLSMSGDVYSSLRDEYRRLFFGPLPPYIVPVESVYKKWTDAPECKLPIAAEKGYLMGDPAMDMIRRYQAHGIMIPGRYSSMPDHIALELEYMAFLCRDASEDEQKEFLKSHLDWIDDLVDDIFKIDMNSFYYSAIHATRTFISFQATP